MKSFLVRVTARREWLTTLLWSALASAVALVVLLTGAISPAESLLRDRILRAIPRQTVTSVAAVLIDEDAIRQYGPWPWTRVRLSSLVDRAFAAGARGVVLDILLPDARPGDDLLALALRRGPSALAAGLDEQGRWLLPNSALRDAVSVGHVSFELDRDGVVRRFFSTKQRGEDSLPALPVAAARLADSQLPVPVGAVLRPGFRGRPIPTIGAASLLASRDAGVIAGRIVFIGTSAAGVGDRVVTPVSPRGSPEPGVLIEAAITEAVIVRDLLRPVTPIAIGLLAGVLSFLCRWIRLRPNHAALPVAFSAAFLPVPLAWSAMVLLHREIAPASIIVAVLVTGGISELARARRQGRQTVAAEQRIVELEAIQAAAARERVQDAEARRVVAHELKTPLTSVRGLVQFLAQFDLSPDERRRVTDMAIAETSRLTEMVDALLDLERLKLKDFTKVATAIDFSALCSERVGVVSAGTQRRIGLDILPGVTVSGDRSLLERVLENLLGNALKFSPPDSQVRVRLQAEGGSEAVLEVEDEGPGIAPAERRRIFQRFARGESAALAPGLGLGLALVAEVVAWHRGSVDADAGRRGGSVFRVKLPLGPVPVARAVKGGIE